MHAIRSFRVLFLSAALLAPLGAALAQQAPQQPSAAEPPPSPAAASIEAMRARYPEGSMDSVATATQARVDVQQARAMLQAEYAAAEAACYDRFFTNNCIDKAKEVRRAGLAVLRPIELDAGAYLRQAKVDQRDRALEERRVQFEAQAQERLKEQQENEQEQARRLEERGRQEQERQAIDAAPAKDGSARVRRHEERLQRQQQQEAAKADERARNVVKFEEKQRQAAERQRRVAEKKAAKEAQSPQASPAPAAPPAPATPATPAR